MQQFLGNWNYFSLGRIGGPAFRERWMGEEPAGCPRFHFASLANGTTLLHVFHRELIIKLVRFSAVLSRGANLHFQARGRRSIKKLKLEACRHDNDCDQVKKCVFQDRDSESMSRDSVTKLYLGPVFSHGHNLFALSHLTELTLAQPRTHHLRSVMTFLFTFKLNVPGLSNPFSTATPSTSIPPTLPDKLSRNRVRSAETIPLQRASPVPSLSPAAPSSRKRGWEPSFAEPSRSTTTIASTSGYLDTPAKYREMAAASNDEFLEVDEVAAFAAGIYVFRSLVALIITHRASPSS